MSVVLVFHALGCSRFVGHVPIDGALDGSAAPDAVASDASDAVAPDTDAPVVPRLCGATYRGCNPIDDTGCADGDSCRIVTLDPIDTECAQPGTVVFAHACRLENECAAGLHCVSHRCLPLCCLIGGGSVCAPFGTATIASHCAVGTDNSSVGACTVPGSCDYTVADACPPGENCFAQSLVGDARCKPIGGLPLYATCLAQEDCESGATCVGDRPGECRTVCSTLVPNPCRTRSRCAVFSDRPLDFGFCDP